MISFFLRLTVAVLCMAAPSLGQELTGSRTNTEPLERKTGATSDRLAVTFNGISNGVQPGAICVLPPPNVVPPLPVIPPCPPSICVPPANVVPSVPVVLACNQQPG